MLALNQIHTGHALELAGQLADNSIHCIITSPPYFGLRSYGTEPVYWPEVSFSPMPGLPPLTIPAQTCNLGLETDPWAYVGHLVALFRELRRALHPAGNCWINLGDSYAGRNGRSNGKVDNGQQYSGKGPNSRLSGMAKAQDIAIKKDFGELPDKNLMMIPARVALALQADGWYLRSDIIWAKPNPMPESVTDRPTKAHEYIFLLAKSEKYFFDQEAIREPVAESTIGRAPVEFGGAKGRDYKPEKNDPNYRNGKEQWGRTFDYQESCANGRNKRTVWTVATVPYPGSHFAVFPPKLVEPCLLAGCPERVCPECGGPWVRVTEKRITGDRHISPKDNNPDRNDNGNVSTSRLHSQYFDYQITTTGWQPTCAHNLDPIPGVVLDPFLGSGTVARVAIEHRRNWIGFELNDTYATDLVTERTNGVQIRLGV